MRHIVYGVINEDLGGIIFTAVINKQNFTDSHLRKLLYQLRQGGCPVEDWNHNQGAGIRQGQFREKYRRCRQSIARIPLWNSPESLRVYLRPD